MGEKLKMLVISGQESLKNDIERSAPDAVQLLSATRASAAIRTFDTETPDAVVVDIGKKPEEAALTVQALRQRPLGALVPIYLVETTRVQHLVATPSGAQEAGADRFFAEGVPAVKVIRAAADALSVEVDLPAAEEGESDQEGSEQEGGVGLTIHSQLNEMPAATGSGSGIGGSSLSGTESRYEVTAEVLRRKLRQVRHEDYFTILEVRKSADLATIAQAYGRHRRRFAEASVPADLSDRYHRELREVRDGLDDAYGVLGAEPLRSAYLKALLGPDR